MPIPVMFLCLMIFFIWLHYEKTKSSRIDMEKSNAFWAKEQQSNVTRKADISNLDYITIPLDQLPFVDTPDPVLIDLQDKVKDLGNQKILNLTGLSNTDLKLQYGVANLNLLSSYDQNYTILTRTLSSWATYLYEHNIITDAKIVLEYAILCHTEISKTYLLLAKIYQSEGNQEAIKNLITTAQTLNTLTKDHIISSLEKFL